MIFEGVQMEKFAKRILCVCKGNTCRSPMVHVFVQQAFAERNIPVIVESAGVMDDLLDGVTFVTANQHSIDIVKEHGLDLSRHIPRHASFFRLDSFDRIIAVNAEIREKLLELGASAGRVFILNEAAGGVPDPYELGRAEYDKCCVTIKAELPKVLKGLLG